ncbi:MAG: hypothetical protein JRJ84_06315 [Deltaproteobacteria bacterium]|nr:hypothetical protein [Deltaproteobacteria bacterium]
MAKQQAPAPQCQPDLGSRREEDGRGPGLVPRLQLQDTMGNAALGQMMGDSDCQLTPPTLGGEPEIAEQASYPRRPVVPGDADLEHPVLEGSEREQQQRLDEAMGFEAPAPADRRLHGLRDGIDKVPLLGPELSGPIAELVENLDQGEKNTPKDSPAVPTEAIEGERQRQKDSTLSGQLGAPGTESTPPIPF